MKLNQTGTPFTRDERNKLNENWRKLENIADEVSGEAFDKIVDGAKIEWLPPVNTFEDLATTYPDITEGKAAMVRANGKVFRFNGDEWIEIQDIDPTVYSRKSQIIVSATEPVDTDDNAYWYEDLGETPININTDRLLVANAHTSNTAPGDTEDLWFKTGGER